MRGTACLTRQRVLFGFDSMVVPCLVIGALLLGALPRTTSAQGALQITTLSTRADMVTGEDVLVRVSLPGNGAAARDVRVRANNADVSSAFSPAPDGDGVIGLVTGLKRGVNTIVAEHSNGANAELRVVDYPASGPVFSGPQETPFICETDKFQMQNGQTLGPSLDENCSAPRRVYYMYRSTQRGELKPLSDLKKYPADVAPTHTSLGRDVPYIIRIETGTANRAIYEIAMLHDPVKEPEPSPSSRSSGWNGRVIYTLGGGCPGGWYRQGVNTGGVTGDELLHLGYAIASSTLNVFGNNCNDQLAAETAMMVKERFIEAYGTPTFTVGTGCSGGSYQGLQAVDNYPGIYDGIIVGCSYPDVQFATTPWNSDARLLLNYFTKLDTTWTKEQQLAATGFVNLDIMELIGHEPGGHASRIQVGESCPVRQEGGVRGQRGSGKRVNVLPDSLLYDPVKNPRGARCSIFDHHVNSLGRDPKTGYARRPIDNVGIQYGLKALNDGKISMAQFLDLNERIGGYDNDGHVTSRRTVGDTLAMRAAYETGRLLNGGGGLASTPVIDFRGYADMQKGGNVHPRFFSFSTKARLQKANGYTDNFVMLTVDGDKYGLFSMSDPVAQEAFRQMDSWLTKLKADNSSSPQIEKVRRAKPSDLVSACWSRDPVPVKIVEEQLDSDHPESRCQQLYPSGSFIRGVAGSNISTDVVKCQLRPVSASDYKQPVKSADLARLRKLFPGGVCDWSKPGVAQRGLRGTWLVNDMAIQP
jgi:hypothetical protein